MATFIDFERKMYTMKPAIRQIIAVRVPEGNMAHAQAKPVIKKKYLCFLILDVMPKIIKATAVEAMATPKFAASL